MVVEQQLHLRNQHMHIQMLAIQHVITVDVLLETEQLHTIMQMQLVQHQRHVQFVVQQLVRH